MDAAVKTLLFLLLFLYSGKEASSNLQDAKGTHAQHYS